MGWKSVVPYYIQWVIAGNPESYRRILNTQIRALSGPWHKKFNPEFFDGGTFTKHILEIDERWEKISCRN